MVQGAGGSRRLAGGDLDLPRRAHRDLAGRRRDAGLVGTRRHPAPGGGHRRTGHPADKATRYLVTNLPRPGGPREAGRPHPAASLAEIVRIYGIRNSTGQSYKQVKDELGWAGFQVRSDTAIRRHQALVNCAFSFCWDAWFAHPEPSDAAPPVPGPGGGERG